MAKILQTKGDLDKQLQNQLELLKILADSYDQGNAVIAKLMATSLRVLLHDTGSSKSLLGQLSMKGKGFFDSCTNFEILKEDVKRMGSFSGLVCIGSKGVYLPYLDESPFENFGFVSFDDYWGRIVLIDNQNKKYSREYLITRVTNQDGGAHVDPWLDQKYAELVKNNSMGWKAGENGNEADVKDIEFAIIRQVVHEILRTLIPDYPKKKMVTRSSVFALSSPIVFSKEKNPSFLIKTKLEKIGRNQKCPCGSGIKYKRCHGK